MAHARALTLVEPDVLARSVAAPDVAPKGIVHSLAVRRATIQEALSALATDTLAAVADLLICALRSGNKVLIAGNGGSAAEAQHFAGELVGRFKRDREPYAVVSLTTDTAILTAIANDYGYADVFSRQVHALGRAGDVLIVFSTSGESDNVVRAAQAAHTRGMTVVGVTGPTSSRLSLEADITIHAPATETDAIQEVHMVVTHLLCDVVESDLSRQPIEAPQ